MQLVDETEPDAILQFGLAGKRKTISVERIARNRANSLRPDASQQAAPQRSVVRPWANAMTARVPAKEIVAALQRAGIAKQSLARCRRLHLQCELLSCAHLGPCALGRLYPYSLSAAAAAGGMKDKRPRFEHIVTAAEIALIVIARAAHRRMATPTRTLRSACSRMPRARKARVTLDLPGLLTPILQIVWIDIVLSGDNAVVIGLACRNLPERQRRLGIALGTGAAVLLRLC